jgi:hypothetical protein
MVTTALDPPSTEPTTPRLRQQVVDILELLAVPTPRHLLQDVPECGGVTVDLAQLTRLRRAEERAFHANPRTGTAGSRRRSPRSI